MQPFPKLLLYNAAHQTATAWNILGPTMAADMRHNKNVKAFKGDDWGLQENFMDGTVLEIILKENGGAKTG